MAAQTLEGKWLNQKKRFSRLLVHFRSLQLCTNSPSLSAVRSQAGPARVKNHGGPSPRWKSYTTGAILSTAPVTWPLGSSLDVPSLAWERRMHREKVEAFKLNRFICSLSGVWCMFLRCLVCAFLFLWDLTSLVLGCQVFVVGWMMLSF